MGSSWDPLGPVQAQGPIVVRMAVSMQFSHEALSAPFSILLLVLCGVAGFGVWWTWVRERRIALGEAAVSLAGAAVLSVLEDWCSQGAVEGLLPSDCWTVAVVVAAGALVSFARRPMIVWLEGMWRPAARGVARPARCRARGRDVRRVCLDRRLRVARYRGGAAGGQLLRYVPRAARSRIVPLRPGPADGSSALARSRRRCGLRHSPAFRRAFQGGRAPAERICSPPARLRRSPRV